MSRRRPPHPAKAVRVRALLACTCVGQVRFVTALDCQRLRASSHPGEAGGGAASGRRGPSCAGGCCCPAGGRGGRLRWLRRDPRGEVHLELRGLGGQSAVLAGGVYHDLLGYGGKSGEVGLDDVAAVARHRHLECAVDVRRGCVLLPGQRVGCGDRDAGQGNSAGLHRALDGSTLRFRGHNRRNCHGCRGWRGRGVCAAGADGAAAVGACGAGVAGACAAEPGAAGWAASARAFAPKSPAPDRTAAPTARTANRLIASTRCTVTLP